MERKPRLSPHLTKGSVLDDLGFTPAQALEIKVKTEVYRELMGHLKKKDIPQQELGTVLGIHQPDVSNLLTGKISKFSVGKLIKFAGKLNLGAEIKLTAGKPDEKKVSAKPGKRALTIA